MSVQYVVGSGFQTVASGAKEYFWEVFGELQLPLETTLGGLRYNESSFTISEATVLFSEAGTAQYNLQVISYDNTGANPVTHIDTNVTPSDKQPISANISSDSVGATRSIEIRLTQLSGTPSTDFSLTLR